MIELFKHHLKLRFEYRAALLFSIVLHPLVMLLILLMFRGIYRHGEGQELLGYSLEQMVWYFGASQFFYYLVWNVVDKNISDKVLYGTIDRDLVRPYSLLTWEFVQLAAHKLLSLLFEAIPVFALYTLILHPEFLTLSGFVQYAILTALALVQFFLMSFSLGVLAFVFQDVSSANAVKFVIVNLLAGVALPIVFFPRGLQELILALPFHYLFHTPVAHLLGTVDVSRWDLFARSALHQSLWIVFFLALALFAYARTSRRLLSVGG